MGLLYYIAEKPPYNYQDIYCPKDLIRRDTIELPEKKE